MTCETTKANAFALTRRNFFLKASAGLSLATVLGLRPGTGWAETGSRTVSLFETHSRETLSVEYWRDGWYNPDALARIDWLLRDWRSDEVTAIDERLVDILFALQTLCGVAQPIHIVCGYRSPTTNASLAQTNGAVAGNSFHMYGRAVDMRVPDYNLRGLRDNALGLEAGGVGYYPRSDFVHVDTGDVRSWS